MSWSARIVSQAAASPGVFKFDATGSADPSFSKATFSGHGPHAGAFEKVNLPELLRKAFKAAKTSSQLVSASALARPFHDLEESYRALYYSSTEPYMLGNPVLNTDGDMIFELHPRATPSGDSVPTRPSSAMSMRPGQGARFPRKEKRPEHGP